MAYFNNDNYYSASTAANEFDSYPFLGYGMLTISEDNQQGTHTFTGGWATVDQPESSVIPSSSLPTTSYGERPSSLSVDLCLTREPLESALPTLGSYLDPSHQPVITETAQPYFNDNGNFCPGSTVPDEFGLYPFLQHEILATSQEVPCQAVSTFANGWTTVNQPGSSATPSANLLATSHGDKSSVSSTTSTLHAGPSEPPLPMIGSYLDTYNGPYQPTISQTTQWDHPGASSQEASFMGIQGWETETRTLTSNPGKYQLGL